MLDIQFHKVGDMENVHGPVQWDTEPEGRHGTAVASILAAKGNNDTLMTGVMWDADLRLYDRRPGPNEGAFEDPLVLDLRRITRAVADGARIINLSGHVGINKDDDIPQGDYHTLELHLETMRAAMLLKRKSPKAPLFVLSAGNTSHPATWTGYPAIDSLDPSRVLVVAAAMRRDPKIVPGTAFGKRAKIAAPGQQLRALDQNGVVLNTFANTSGAAPYVSGVAGLLASFDSTLTAAEIRNLILDGAKLGGRSVRETSTTWEQDSGRFIVNAYESIKLASQRLGAPICGQRVWAEGNAIYVERTPGGAKEALVATSGKVWDIDVLHGGHQIDYYDGGVVKHLFNRGGGWKGSGAVSSDPPGDVWMSMNGYSHDFDAAIYTGTTRGDPTSNNIPEGYEEVDITISDTLGRRSAKVQFKLGPLGVQMSPSFPGDPTGRVTSIAAAFPSRGSTALVAVNRMRATSGREEFGCTDDRGIDTICTLSFYRWVPDTAFLYTFDTRSPTPTADLVRAIPDTMVYWLGFTRGDSATIAGMGSEVDVWSNAGGGGLSVSWCNIDHRDARLAGPSVRPVSSLDACVNQYGSSATGAGTMNRLPDSSKRRGTHVVYDVLHRRAPDEPVTLRK